MEKFTSINDILEFAINQEQKAVDFYLKLSAISTNAEMKVIFEDFAKEEVQHKAKLLNIKESNEFSIPTEKISSLNIADYVVNPNIDENTTYEDALKIAMAREKASFKLYSRLAEETENPYYADLFRMLAQEEAKHKLRFEIEYDDVVLKNN